MEGQMDGWIIRQTNGSIDRWIFVWIERKIDG